MNKHRVFLAIVILTLLGLIAACAPASTPVPPTQPPAPTKAPVAPTVVAPPAATPTAIPATAVPPTAAPTVAPKPKILTIGMSVDMTNFDLTYPLDQATRSVIWNINDPLFREGKPVLIDTYKMIDPQSWEFKLKKGIKFQNGMPLTADDVKFTIETIIDPKRTPPSIIKTRMEHIDKIDIIDELTFRTHTKTKDVALPLNLISFTPVPRKYYEEKGLAFVSKNPVGVGAFKFVEWVKDSHVALEANKDYWGGAPKIDRVVYKIIPETGARMSALRAGQIDIAIYVPPEEQSRLTQQGFSIVGGPIERTVIVAFNEFVCEPCKNKLVRQAMIYAVDREAIAKEILQGLGQVVPTLIAPENLGYDSNLKPMPYDVKKAKELLTQAGYGNGFKVTFHATEGRTTKDKETAQAIVGYLREVGIQVTLQTLQYQDFINIKNANKFQDLWMIGWANGNYDGPSNAIWLLRSKSTLWADQLVNDPTMDALMDASTGAATLEDRSANLKKVLQYAYDQAYFMPLYRYVDAYAVSKRVLNWVPPTDELVVVGVKTDVTP